MVEVLASDLQGKVIKGVVVFVLVPWIAHVARSKLQCHEATPSALQRGCVKRNRPLANSEHRLASCGSEPFCRWTILILGIL